MPGRLVSRPIGVLPAAPPQPVLRERVPAFGPFEPPQSPKHSPASPQLSYIPGLAGSTCGTPGVPLLEAVMGEVQRMSSAPAAVGEEAKDPVQRQVSAVCYQ